MRTGISISVTAADRVQLEAIVAARSSPQKHVWRARIILLSDQGFGASAIMAAAGKSKTCVWRWQERFMAEGVEGLLRDKTRLPGIAPLDAAAEIAIRVARSHDLSKRLIQFICFDDATLRAYRLAADR